MRILNGEITSIHSAAILLGAAGLLSRALGVLRDRLLASHFGAGRELDVYYAAFQIPDLMSVLFLLGAGSAAILPVFQEYLQKDREGARQLISGLISVFLAGALIAAGIAFIASPLLMKIITPGFSEEDREMTVTLTRIMLLAPILFGLSGIFSSVVQSFQRFLAYALAPVLYNIGIILGIFFFLPGWGLKGLAMGVVLGSFLHLAIQIEAVFGLGFLPRVGWIPRDIFFSGIRRITQISFPRFLSISLSNITILLLVALGSTLAAGSIAVFRLAQNLFFVPIGIFGISYAVALFPRISRAYLSRDPKIFYEELYLGIRAIIFWVVPSLVIFMVLRAHIVRLALGAGAFSWEDTRLSAAVLAVLAIAMWAEGIISLLIKAYYALENTWIPLFINIFATLVSLFFAFLFTQILKTPTMFTRLVTGVLRIPDLPHPEVVGLGLGFSLGVTLNAVLLIYALKRLAARTFGDTERFPLGSVAKMALAALIAGGAAYAARVSFSETLPLITFLRVLGQGTAAGAAGFLAYFGVLFVLKNEEVVAVWRTFRKRLFRIGVLPKGWDEEAHISPNP